MRRKIPTKINITGSRIKNSTNGAANNPATVPISPSGTAIKNTTKTENNTANILRGSIKINIPVLNNTESTFKKSKAARSITSTLNSSIFTFYQFLHTFIRN